MLQFRVLGRVLIAAFALALASAPNAGTAQQAPAVPQVDLAGVSADQWRADLRYLAEQMPKVHVNLYHTMTREQLDAGVADLDRRIPSLNTDEILVGLARVTALVQDGHSGVIGPLTFTAQTSYPLRLNWYPNGIFVEAAPAEYASLVGGRLVRIGNAPVERAYAEISALVPHDPANDGLQRVIAPRVYFTSPRVLHGLGFTPTAGEAAFEVERDGKRISATVKPAPSSRRHFVAVADSSWVDAGASSPNPLPLSRKHPDQPYWYEYLPAQHAVYVQFNGVSNDGSEPLATFFRGVFDFVDRNDVQRMVIDLRNNGGGNNQLLRPVIVGLIQAKKIDQRGRLVAIIGPQTFSAAQNFVNRMENYTEVAFVGTPTGENVNFYGDVRPIVLPNSKLGIGMSALRWQDMDMRDKRTNLSPEIAVDPSFADYRAHADPALDEALTGRFVSLEDALGEALPHGYAGTLAAYNTWTGDTRHRYVTNAEARVNALGYKLLNDKRADDAIVAFRVNADTHPKSANAFDSLGEAYDLAGRKTEAIAAYERSVQLNPTSPSGLAALARLRN
jgi:hypothetical protein